MSKREHIQLRDAFGAFMTGVTVVTTVDAEGAAAGFTANSFSSVSLDPPLLLVCPANSLSSFDTFLHCEHFAVSVLAADQQDASNAFAGSSPDRFASVPLHNDENGCPLVTGFAARFSCQAANAVPAGDHLILVGEIQHFETTGKGGLGYVNGGYFSLELERRAANLAETTGTVHTGAVVEFEDAILMQETDLGWQPLSVTAQGQAGSLASLRQFFTDKGLDISIGPVYSIFDGKNNGEYSTFYRATAGSAETGGAARYIAMSALHELKFTSPAIAEMMRRYMAEREKGVFNLYVGDEFHGDIHSVATNR